MLMDQMLSLLGLGNNSCHRALKLSLKMNHVLLNCQCKLLHSRGCALSDPPSDSRHATESPHKEAEVDQCSSGPSSITLGI
jgi:hypothetical protein